MFVWIRIRQSYSLLLRCPNKCSSQSCVLFSLQQLTRCSLFRSPLYVNNDMGIVPLIDPRIQLTRFTLNSKWVSQKIDHRSRATGEWRHRTEQSYNIKLQWGSKYCTSLVFKWFKQDNGQMVWNSKFQTMAWTMDNHNTQADADGCPWLKYWRT